LAAGASAAASAGDVEAWDAASDDLPRMKHNGRARDEAVRFDSSSPESSARARASRAID
jgi:hypothetical protein